MKGDIPSYSFCTELMTTIDILHISSHAWDDKENYLNNSQVDIKFTQYYKVEFTIIGYSIQLRVH